VKTLAVALTALVALERLGFLGLEIFAWTLPLGQATFLTNPDFAKATAALAANQGSTTASSPPTLGLRWDAATSRCGCFSLAASSSPDRSARRPRSSIFCSCRRRNRRRRAPG